mmetsp:Transcript_23202/g.66564  ORF Transcript_23202/g.66564 Transcript_23202/m.66564 type:complete len:203 (-) Transcript_23202:2530-3138(-)
MVQAIGPPLRLTSELHKGQHSPDLLVAVHAVHIQVRPHCATEEPTVLGDDAQARPQLLQRNPLRVPAVESDLAAAAVHHAEACEDNGALAGASAADDANLLARVHAECHVLQGERQRRLVPHVHALEAENAPCGPRLGHLVLELLCGILRGLVLVLCHPLDRRHHRLDPRRHVERHRRLERQHRAEGEDGTGGPRRNQLGEW